MVDYLTERDFVFLAETVRDINDLSNDSVRLTLERDYARTLRSIKLSDKPAERSALMSRTKKRMAVILGEQSKLHDRLAVRALEMAKNIETGRGARTLDAPRKNLIVVLKATARMYAVRAQNDRVDAGYHSEDIALPGKAEQRRAQKAWESANNQLAKYAINNGFIDQYEFLLLN